MVACLMFCFNEPEGNLEGSEFLRSEVLNRDNLLVMAVVDAVFVVDMDRFVRREINEFKLFRMVLGLELEREVFVERHENRIDYTPFVEFLIHDSFHLIGVFFGCVVEELFFVFSFDAAEEKVYVAGPSEVTDEAFGDVTFLEDGEHLGWMEAIVFNKLFNNFDDFEAGKVMLPDDWVGFVFCFIF